MKPSVKPFVLCINNADYGASLVIRIVDESGEDYLYHKGHFVLVDFPKSVKKKILAAAGVT